MLKNLKFIFLNQYWQMFGALGFFVSDILIQKYCQFNSYD